MRFPEILRTELLPVLQGALADNRYDRLTFSGWGPATSGSRLHGQVSAWEDEDDSGGSSELGIDVENFLTSESHTDLTVFSSAGQFTTGGGARVSYGRSLEGGQFNLAYEIALQHHKSFPSDRDDLIQHRARLTRSFYTASGWDLSVHAEGRLWDDELSWAAGIYLQRSF